MFGFFLCTWITLCDLSSEFYQLICMDMKFAPLDMAEIEVYRHVYLIMGILSMHSMTLGMTESVCSSDFVNIYREQQHFMRGKVHHLCYVPLSMLKPVFIEYLLTGEQSSGNV